MTRTREDDVKTIQRFAARAVAMVVATVVVTTTQQGLAQSFSSGSDGSDGALTVAQNLGTVLFDPTDTARWGGSTILMVTGSTGFTTITIGSGSYSGFERIGSIGLSIGLLLALS